MSTAVSYENCSVELPRVGDDDLDVVITGTTVTVLLETPDGVGIVGISGGWDNRPAAGGFPEPFGSATFTWQFADPDGAAHDDLIDRLAALHGRVVDVLGAPGRPYLIADSAGCWAAIPRRG